jgi:TRAP-type mannitol/chloroaromatic compound transport system permease large subunit
VTNVTIYQFTLYDIGSDEFRKSRRWATREVIEAIGGQLLEGTATVVDASAVALGASSIIGMTRRGYNPQVNASAHVL